MKFRLAAAIVLLAASIASAAFCLAHINKCTDELDSALQAALACAAAQSDGWEDATAHVLRIWQSDRDFYHILLPHTNINELEWSIGSLPDFLAQRESKAYVEQCIRGLQCVKTVREMERVTWGSVF